MKDASSSGQEHILVLIHGIFSDINDAFGPCISRIKKAGGYDNVAGYNYDWAQPPNIEGPKFATFINNLADSISPTPSIDIEAHSYGSVITYAALPEISSGVINNVVTLGGPLPLEGSPMPYSNTVKLLNKICKLFPKCVLSKIGEAERSGMIRSLMSDSSEMARIFQYLPSYPSYIQVAGTKYYFLEKAIKPLWSPYITLPWDGVVEENAALETDIPNVVASTSFAVTHTDLECGNDQNDIIDWVGQQVNPQGSQTFTYTGAEQTFKVPNVRQLTIEASGAGGAANGGAGALVMATIPVAPGETLAVFVGGAGGNNGGTCCGDGGPGYNGGGGGGQNACGAGGGGGASDVRQRGRRLEDRIIVAGGGGGGGGGRGNITGGSGGAGGETGAAGQSGVSCGPYCGGAGDGGNGGNYDGGGIAGQGGSGGGSQGSPGYAGADGARGLGGNGGYGGSVNCSSQPCGCDAGGAGGGYYGGGGGGGGGSSTYVSSYASSGGPGGGGGGGSSFIETNASDEYYLQGGGSTGDGQIVISWGRQASQKRH